MSLQRERGHPTRCLAETGSECLDMPHSDRPPDWQPPAPLHAGTVSAEMAFMFNGEREKADGAGHGAGRGGGAGG